jgi:hypothetical protein
MFIRSTEEQDRKLLQEIVKVNPWTNTVSGKDVHLLNPSPDKIDIKDIAAGLSKMCRYNGQISEFYSVAQHSVYAAILAKPESRMHALLHDSSEAYLGDVISPLKSLLINYEEIEKRMMSAIAQKFNFSFDDHEHVHEIDQRLLTTEVQQLIPHHNLDWKLTAPAYPFKIEPWRWWSAEEKFLLFYEIIEKNPNGEYLQWSLEVLMEAVQ